MSVSTANMSLVIPTTGDTDYPTSISTSLTNVDLHDHTSGKGIQIPTGGIADLAVTTAKLAANAVTTAKITDANVTRAKLVAVGQQISSASNFTTSSTTAVDATGLTVTITTTGRPVVLALVSSTASFYSEVFISDTATSQGVQIGGALRFLRDATVVAHYSLINTKSFAGGSNHTFSVPCSSYFHLDVPAAGTYTYKVQALVLNTTNTTIGFNEAKLLAYEL